MKWYRNKQMLNETFEQNNNYLQKTKSEKTQCLLLDYNNLIKDHLELLDENEKLKKALEKSCKLLSWDCPCSQDLIDDLDCEDRCQPNINYAECWKKYFLKEVVNNESNNT